jgi:hypothetical protein
MTRRRLILAACVAVVALDKRGASLKTSAGVGVGVGVNDLSDFTAFPPLAAGVLVEAGGFESIPGNQMGECVEEQQVGFEPANSIGPKSTRLALGVDGPAAAKVRDGGRVAWGAADVDADHLALHPPGPGVIAKAVGAGFPGHGRRVTEAAQAKRRYTIRRARGKGWAHAWAKRRV